MYKSNFAIVDHDTIHGWGPTLRPQPMLKEILRSDGVDKSVNCEAETMTRISALALLAPVALCLLCVAQPVTVDVVDQSTVKCPVRLSGRVDIAESEIDGVNRTSYLDHFSTTNLSNVPIVAIVTFNQIGNSMGPLVGQNNLLDAFFAHDLEIAPRQTYTHGHQENGVFSVPVPRGGVKVAPAASSQLVFVEFADGSTCGDRNDGRVISLMDTRADILLALKSLDDASKKGEAEFVKALLAVTSKDRTRHAESVLDSIRDRQSKKGTANAIDYIHSMLAVAASR